MSSDRSTSDNTDETALPPLLDEAMILKVGLGLELFLAVISLFWAYQRSIDLLGVITAQTLLLCLAAPLPLLLANYQLHRAAHGTGALGRTLRRFGRELIVPLCAALRPRSILLLSVASGVAEELFFRGILETELRHVVTPWAAAAASALIFSYLHFIGALRRYWPVPLFYFLFGLYFSLLTSVSQSLLPAITAHAVSNGVAMQFVRRRLIDYITDIAK